MEKVKVRDKFYIVSDIINLGLLYTVLFVAAKCFSFFIAESVVDLKEVSFTWVLGMFLLLLVLESYLFRAFITKLYIYLLVHLPMIPIVLFLGDNIYTKIVGIVLLVAFFIADIIYWTNQPGKTISYLHPGLISVPIGFFVLCEIFKSDVAAQTAIMGSIVFFILSFLRLFFDNADKLSRTAMASDNSSFSAMILGNLRMALPVLLVSFVVMILVDTKSAANLIFNGFNNLMRRLLGLIKIDEVEQPALGTSGEYNSISTDLSDLNNNDSPLWLSWFYRITFWIVAAVILSILVYVIVKFINRFIKEFGNREISKRAISEDVKGNYTETVEKIVREKPKKSESLQSVRKKYKKEIEQLAKRGYEIDLSQTPMERCIDVNDKMSKDIKELTENYTKERYRA